MKVPTVTWLAILALATLQAIEGYEIIYPYGYVDPMMRSAYESPAVQPPSSRLLLAPLPNLFSKGCPSNVVGGQVVGNVCFTVNTTPTSFTAALASCQANGGTLAQPAPVPALSQAFYSALKAKFRLQFTTVEAAATNPGTFWIGYIHGIAASPFDSQDFSGKTVLATNPIFVAAPAATTAAAIVNPGTNWSGILPGTLLPFICQYTLVV